MTYYSNHEDSIYAKRNTTIAIKMHNDVNLCLLNITILSLDLANLNFPVQKTPTHLNTRITTTNMKFVAKMLSSAGILLGQLHAQCHAAVAV